MPVIVVTEEVDLGALETSEVITILGAEEAAEMLDQTSQVPPHVTIVVERDIFLNSAHRRNRVRLTRQRKLIQSHTGSQKNRRNLMEIGESGRRKLKWHPHL